MGSIYIVQIKYKSGLGFYEYWMKALSDTDLLVDSGMPSLLHSTVTVDEGRGLTLQGSTPVCPTKASTVSGSDLSMLTPPRVRL